MNQLFQISSETLKLKFLIHKNSFLIGFKKFNQSLFNISTFLNKHMILLNEIAKKFCLIFANKENMSIKPIEFEDATELNQFVGAFYCKINIKESFKIGAPMKWFIQLFNEFDNCLSKWCL
eukprot:TRINITY_DN2565_c0_g2_i1.p1 TRINITY_DN2565_c0_g2~~TRINITY_DN2565_c0_g2_i1.p1  ORF type:complete len:121 (-),score=29.75 TRINITY_DN2565_c0_g2_i1:1-363(-)